MSDPETGPCFNIENSRSALPNPFRSLSLTDAAKEAAAGSLPGTEENVLVAPGAVATGNFYSQLDVQFPLRHNLLFGQANLRPGSAPYVISLVAAMANPKIAGSNCLLIPIRDNVAALTAVLCAFQSAVAHFPEQLQKYLETSFQRGERVRVLPEGSVYVFNGHIKHGGKQFFSLKFLDDFSNASRSFSINEAVRLEKTNARSPKGSGNAWAAFERSKLDVLIGTNAGGNNALFSNEVILATTQKSFSEFLANVYVASSVNPEHYFPLENVIPWGTIGAEGNIEFRNSAAASGAPLIAVASRSEYVAAFCRQNEARESVVIVDGAERVKDLQSLDDIISSKSKLLVIADHSELDLLPTISSRGVQIFRMSGAPRDLVGKGFGILGRFQQAADRADTFRIETIECTSRQIDEIADHILRAETELRETGADEVVLSFISIAYSRLLDIASLVSVPDAEVAQRTIDELNSVSAEITNRRNFLPVKALYNLRSACSKLSRCIDGSSSEFFGQEKQDRLLELVDQSYTPRESAVVVCHSTMAVGPIGRLLESRKRPNFRVSTINTFLTGDSADHVILTGWPRSRNLQKLLSCYEMVDIHVLAYGFEALWFRNSLKRRARSISRWQSSGDVLERMTGLVAGSEAAVSEEAEPDSLEPASERITTFEASLPKVRKGRSAFVPTSQESKPAKYVGFVGQSYCYLTASHELPKVTDILRGTQNQSGGVRSVAVSDLVCGDRVLFRMSSDSDKDMIRLLAETLSPPGEYERRRNVAKSWKDALNKVGADAPQIVATLRNGGLHRSLQTVRNWIANPNLIGPASIDDLVLIARAANDTAFAARIADVWDAIQTTRGSHMTAGFKLSQLLIREFHKQIPDPSEAETIVELTNEDVPFGRVAIVEVDDISEVFEQRSYMEVNRLLW